MCIFSQAIDKIYPFKQYDKPRKTNWRERLSTVVLLVKTSLLEFLFKMQIIFIILKN